MRFASGKPDGYAYLITFTSTDGCNGSLDANLATGMILSSAGVRAEALVRALGLERLGAFWADHRPDPSNPIAGKSILVSALIT